ncbi:MAG TPA: hypothetical protein VHG28_16775 [Longimicrobiaceae bacterium]|nr:hypothetical protein [Longimicrobiaceae bacterium]
MKITLRSGDFDAYLAVGRMEKGGFVSVETDDDGGGGTDAQVVLTLADDGEYVFRANTLSGGETGAYTISVESAGNGNGGGTGITVRDTNAGKMLHPSRRPVRSGETGSGELEQSEPKTFDGFGPYTLEVRRQ